MTDKDAAAGRGTVSDQIEQKKELVGDSDGRHLIFSYPADHQGIYHVEGGGQKILDQNRQGQDYQCFIKFAVGKYGTEQEKSLSFQTKTTLPFSEETQSGDFPRQERAFLSSIPETDRLVNRTTLLKEAADFR